MCEIVNAAVKQAMMSRRGLLGGVAAVGAAAGLPAVAGPAAAAPTPQAMPGTRGRHRTELVLLGTGGGPVWWPGSDREGIGSAVVVDGDVYLVDFGEGSGRRFKQAALVPEEMQTAGGLWGEEFIRAMFITHLHSDHVQDYFDYFMMGWVNGLKTRPFDEPIQVHGPGPRVDADGDVVLAPVFTLPGEEDPQIPVENPDNPVPGTVAMTDALYAAYATDINDRLRDNRITHPREQFAIHDIAIPRSVGFHPNDNPAPDGMAPLDVYEDDKVKVTATLVRHMPVAPAFAFRFDTDDGSVVFSGDTGPSANLVRLARGADVLVHEVITQQWVDTLFPEPRDPGQEALRNHLLVAHTLPEDAGRVAEEAGVDTLVFSHIVPGFAPDHHLLPAKRTFSGRLVIGRDLMHLGIGDRVK